MRKLIMTCDSCKDVINGTPWHLHRPSMRSSDTTNWDFCSLGCLKKFITKGGKNIE